MPLYQHVILTLPKASKKSLAALFNRYADVVFSLNGTIRGIENHGVRNLAERTRRQYPALDGTRYFWDARFVTVTFDGTPTCLSEIDRFLRTEESVLRQFAVKVKSNVELSKAMTYKNPYKNV
jgi:ribosomal protein S6